ncbi:MULTISPECIES: glycosyltransferase family 4 protein [Yersinia]|uniref:Glycosyltransferase n=1 Tax=Yersinia frederiksenii TaxID=29484 RepID=A0AAI8ZMX9_YERFR|nr:MULTISPECIES: glycosyltransferase family 4 protein [Yersinia]MDN0125893.1 glycosyltransferase family 4 protein [Yersinia massiliensis]CFQ85224.1 putative glycosyltransferase [Yersinia frederiksenii]
MPRNRLSNDEPKTLKVGVIHLATEGIQLFVGGVGSFIRGQIEALPEVIELLAAHHIILQPHFIEIACSRYHCSFNDERRAHYIRHIHAMGGSFSTVPNMTMGNGANCSWPYGDAFLGNLQNWQISSAAGAAKIIDICANYDITLAFCHELPFSLTPLIARLQAAIEGVNLKVIFVSHGTAFNHEMPLPNPERLMAESLPVHWAKIDTNIKLGFISQFMATHLVAQYGADPQGFVPVLAGIDIDDPWFRLRSDQVISHTLLKYGIPLDRPLAITLGRGVQYKRHDLLLKASCLLNNDIHPVIVSDPVLPELVQLAQSTQLASQLASPPTIIHSFDRELMACLIQWHNTRVCVLSAENEPNGLIPMEARWLARKQGALLVVADSGGLSEQVTPGIDGFRHIAGDAENLACVIQQICTLSDVEISHIRQAGAALIKARYQWKNQIMASLASLIPEIATLH